MPGVSFGPRDNRHVQGLRSPLKVNNGPKAISVSRPVFLQQRRKGGHSNSSEKVPIANIPMRWSSRRLPLASFCAPMAHRWRERAPSTTSKGAKIRIEFT